MSSNKFDLLNYTFVDLRKSVHGKDKSVTKFDIALKEKWTQALENGIFRYKLDIKDWKVLEGKYKFLAQLNVDRAVNKRKPENVSSMSQPFDPNSFNFNKIREEEVMFDIEDGSGNNVVAINVSPIEWGHCLLLPQRFKNLPQIMTESSLKTALELLLISNSVNLRVVFNSLGACASVNHLHWHLYYLKHRMPLESIDFPYDFARGPVRLLKNYPAKGFCVLFSKLHLKAVEIFERWIFLIIDYFQRKNIAYNVYMTRAKSNCSMEVFDDIRVYIWARKPNFDIESTSAFIPAACELFGHLSIRTQEDYESLTENEVEKIFNDLTSDLFDTLVNDIYDLLMDANGLWD